MGAMIAASILRRARMPSSLSAPLFVGSFISRKPAPSARNLSNSGGCPLPLDRSWGRRRVCLATRQRVTPPAVCAREGGEADADRSDGSFYHPDHERRKDGRLL